MARPNEASHQAAHKLVENWNFSSGIRPNVLIEDIARALDNAREQGYRAGWSDHETFAKHRALSISLLGNLFFVGLVLAMAFNLL